MFLFFFTIKVDGDSKTCRHGLPNFSLGCEKPELQSKLLNFLKIFIDQDKIYFIVHFYLF